MVKEHRVLFVDAYDSFSENIIALLRQLLGATLSTIKIDADIPSNEASPFKDSQASFESFLGSFDAIVIGPGPGNPANPSDIGVIPLIWDNAVRHGIPVLGICLGFQSLCLSFHVPVTRMGLPCHGHAKEIHHLDQDIFLNVGKVFATNYNSLGVNVEAMSEEFSGSRPSSVRSGSSDSTNSTRRRANSFSPPSDLVRNSRLGSRDLIALAWDDSGWLMGVRHNDLPLWGLQFHPESCKSNSACHDILKNWWKATVDWNYSFRNQAMPPTGLSLDKSLRISSDSHLHSRETPSNEKDAIVKELLRLCKHSRIVVDSFTLPFSGDLLSTAALCYQQSIPGTTGLLESTKKGRYSVYAMPTESTWRLECFADHLVIYQLNQSIKTWSIPHAEVFEVLEQVISGRKAKGGRADVPFWGGFIGFISYEMGLDVLKVQKPPTAEGQLVPYASFMWVERSVVIDKVQQLAHVQSIREDDSHWIRETALKISNLKPKVMENQNDEDFSSILASSQISLPDEAAYKAKIHACQSHLRAGNSYELCLTTEAQVRLKHGQAWQLYKTLRQCNPVPFAAFLQLGKTTILSSSPEQFLTWDRHGTIDMVPMKGTVKKTADMTLAKATEILSSPKESAENLMIADLIRHDLYSSVGSDSRVEVVKLCEVLEHETVFQLVSHIRAHAPIPAKLSEKKKQGQVIKYGHKALRQAMPPGSMTGAPKKRSCEILTQLEQRQRGVYSGVLGYLDIGGAGAFSVCIRTAFSSDGDDGEDRDGLQTWRIGAGGAITVLSDVDAEWDEMRTKLDSVLRAFRS